AGVMFAVPMLPLVSERIASPKVSSHSRLYPPDAYSPVSKPLVRSPMKTPALAPELYESPLPSTRHCSAAAEPATAPWPPPAICRRALACVRSYCWRNPPVLCQVADNPPPFVSSTISAGLALMFATLPAASTVYVLDVRSNPWPVPFSVRRVREFNHSCSTPPLESQGTGTPPPAVSNIANCAAGPNDDTSPATSNGYATGERLKPTSVLDPNAATPLSPPILWPFAKLLEAVIAVCSTGLLRVYCNSFLVSALTSSNC